MAAYSEELVGLSKICYRNFTKIFQLEKKNFIKRFYLKLFPAFRYNSSLRGSASLRRSIPGFSLQSGLEKSSFILKLVIKSTVKNFE